jgi:hypothetical protein
MAKNPPKTVPVLYRAPVALNVNEHAGLKVSTAERKYHYARNVNSIPVVLSEVTQLMPHYPIVFSSEREPHLIALLGVRQDENLFVDAAGNWAPGTYIPAYVRRYPFILMEMGDNKFGLGADLHEDFFVEDGTPLFQGGRATLAADRAMRFSLELQKAYEETRQFCKAMTDAKVIRGKVFSASNRRGQKFRMTGFGAIDESTLDALDNRTANSWRKRHWLKYVYCHMVSLERLRSFPARTEQRIAA